MGSKLPEPALVLKPRFRGRIHQMALLVSVPAAAALIIAAPSGSTRLAMLVYGLSLVGLFGASTAYHRLNLSPGLLRRLRSLDHSMIFLLIAGTYTGFGVLVMEGLWRVVVLAVVWAGALTGVTLKLIRVEGFTVIGGALYIALGWVGIAALPDILRGAAILPLILTAIGGLMYTGGAVVLLKRRPDPAPLVFGYHEVWHVLVVAASACHYTAITLLLRAGA